MKRTTLVVLLILILAPSLSAGREITSVYPEPATVGAPVTIIGGPFVSTDRIVIGGQEVIPRLVDERQLIFVVPKLDAGTHALYLQADQQKLDQTISFRVNLPPPRINALEPANIAECSTENERIVSVTGNHFRVGSQLLLGGQIMPSTLISETEISFTAPPLKAGTHGVQIINPDGSESLPHSLWLNNIPRIYAVSNGDDFVSTYQLIISGKNFAHNSSLLVYEYPVGLTDLPPHQRIIPAQGGSAFHGEQARELQSEAFIYIDCNTLIYNRYPYSRQDKRIILRVGNPDGKQTEIYELFTP